MSAPVAHDGVSFKDRATADQVKPHNHLLVIELTIQDIDVARVLVDTGCSANIIYKSTLERMEIDMCAITEGPSQIFGLSGDTTMTLGSINLLVKAGSIVKITELLVVDAGIRSATEPEVNPKPYSTSQGANQNICGL